MTYTKDWIRSLLLNLGNGVPDEDLHHHIANNGRLSLDLEHERSLNQKLQEAGNRLAQDSKNLMKEMQQMSQLALNNTLPALPIQLRPGVRLTIEGLPTDLSPQEAIYIAGILAAYAQPIPHPTLEAALDAVDFNAARAAV